jgi:Ca2+-binding EF-hand superfamily protein
MRRNCYYVAIIVIFIVLFISGIFTQKSIASDKKVNFIDNFDKDQDGKLSQEEYRGSDASFKQMDKNQDGYLDETEVQKGRPPGRSDMQKRGGGYINNFDKDQDGKLSQEEYPGSDTSFKRMDQNQDGYLDETEVQKGRSPGRSDMQKRGGGYINNFDKNQDGKLSQEEYPGSDTSFKRMDQNQDGYIDENEFHRGRPSKNKPKKTE